MNEKVFKLQMLIEGEEVKKLFLFFSHKLTQAQQEEAKKVLGVEEFVALPQNLQERFSAVPPELESLDTYIRDFVEFLVRYAQPGDYVLAQGDFGLVYRIVELAKAMGLVPIYATTRRVVLEEKRGEETIKISRFEHVRFRRYL